MIRPGRSSGRNVPTGSLWVRLSAVGHAQLPLLACTIALCLVFSIAAPAAFPTLLNLQAISFMVPEIGLLALAVMLSMVAAGIDLSVVAIANLAALAAAEYLHALGLTSSTPDSYLATGTAVILALMVGAACGTLNALLISRVGITPILATLATGSLFAGAAIVWTGGYSVVDFPGSLRALGGSAGFGVPVPVAVYALAVVGAAVLLNRTSIGFQIGLVGANSAAARFAGIRESRVLLATYAASGVFAALGGVMILARSGSATPDYGQSYVFLAVVIAVLGGVDLAGGFGSVAGTVLATICLVVVQAGVTTLGLSQFLYLVIQGLVLIGVMAVRRIQGRDNTRGLRRVTISVAPGAAPQIEPGGQEVPARK